MEGTVESKEVVAAFRALADALVAAKEDGKIDFFDLPKFIKVLVAFKDAVGSAEKVPMELKDLSSEELSDLLADLMQVVMVFSKLFLP